MCGGGEKHILPHFKKAFFQTILCFGQYQQYSTALPDVSTSLRRTSVNLIDKTRLPDEEISVEEAVGITLDDVDPLVVVAVVLSVGVDVVVVVEIVVVVPVADATIPKSYKSYLQKSRQTKSGAKIKLKKVFHCACKPSGVFTRANGSGGGRGGGHSGSDSASRKTVSFDIILFKINKEVSSKIPHSKCSF